MTSCLNTSATSLFTSTINHPSCRYVDGKIMTNLPSLTLLKAYHSIFLEDQDVPVIGMMPRQRRHYKRTVTTQVDNSSATVS